MFNVQYGGYGAGLVFSPAGKAAKAATEMQKLMSKCKEDTKEWDLIIAEHAKISGQQLSSAGEVVDSLRSGPAPTTIADFKAAAPVLKQIADLVLEDYPEARLRHKVKMVKAMSKDHQIRWVKDDEQVIKDFGQTIVNSQI